VARLAEAERLQMDSLLPVQAAWPQAEQEALPEPPELLPPGEPRFAA
jgi:hypothetical protein